MLSIKNKPYGDDTILYYNAHTNDPIAVVKRKKSIYGTKDIYTGVWHPDVKLMYPDAEHFVNMLPLDDADSAKTASARIEGAYERLLSGKHRDPLQTKFVGEITKSVDGVDKTYHQYHVFDNENNHFATLNIDKKRISSIPTDDTFARNGAFLEFHGKKPSLEQFTVLNTKNPSNNPVSLLKRAAHWLKVKDSEPSFIGSHQTNNTQVFKTKLDPEKAIDAYVNAIKETGKYNNHTFQKVSPTMVIANKPARYEYEVPRKEIIDSGTAGELHHHTLEMPASNHYTAKQLNQVID